MDISEGQRAKMRARIGIYCATEAGMFRHFFPKRALERIVSATNTTLEPPMVLEEFFAYLGILMRLADENRRRRDLWGSNAPEYYHNPGFERVMSHRRFDAITSALRLTTKLAPAYRDPFYEIRELVDDWNEHIVDIYTYTVMHSLPRRIDGHVLQDRRSWLYVCPAKAHAYGQ